MKISHKLILGFLLVASLGSATTFFTLRSYKEINNTFAQLKDDSTKTKDILNGLKQSGERIVSSTSEIGFIIDETDRSVVDDDDITDEEAQLTKPGYQEFENNISLYSEMVRTIVPDDANTVETIRATGYNLTETSKDIVDLKKRNIRGARIRLKRHEFEAEEATFLKYINKALEKESDEQIQEQQNVENSISLGTQQSLMFTALTFLLAISSGLYISIVISNRIKKLKIATEKVGSGALDAYIEIESKDEVGDLSRSFNKMIGDLKGSRADLAAREKHFRAMIEKSSDGVALFTPDGIIRYASPSTPRVLGYTPDEITGMNAAELIPPEDQAAFGEALGKLVRTPGATVEIVSRIRHKDGSVRWLEGTFTNLLDDPDIGAIVNNYRDVTERKRSELEREVISQIVEGVATTENLDELLHLIHRSIGQVLNADNCYVALYDAPADLISVPFCIDKYDTVAPPTKLGNGLTAHVIRQGLPMLMTPDVIGDLTRRGVAAPVGTEPAIWLGVPLKTPEGIIGALVVQHYEDPGVYKARDVEFLSSVGDQIALSIERKRAENTLRENEEKFRELVENANDVIYTLDMKGNFTSLNRAGETMSGYSRTEAAQKSLTDIIAPESISSVYERFALNMQGIAQPNFELEIIAKDGRKLTMDVSSRLIRQNGVAVGLQGIGRDITERKRIDEETEHLNAEIESQRERLNTIVGNLQGVVWETKTKMEKGETSLRFDFVSDYIETILGYTVEECLAQQDFWLELIHPDDREGTKQRVLAIFAGGKGGTVEFRWIARDGHEVWVESRNSIIWDTAGKAVGLRGIAVDITERKSLEDQLTHQALHDPLTKLGNRVLFRDRVEHAIKRTARKHTPIAVLFLDLDNFKSVNDSLGHAAGDELLVSVTERLQACLRSGDTPARFGGDEFAVLLEDLEHADQASFIAERIRSVLCTPFFIAGTEVFIGSSIGIAVTIDGRETPEELLRNADVAMYMSKSNGKDRYTIFENKMHDVLIKRIRLESDMRSAIDNEEFEVYYQPIMDLDSGEVMGIEALVRWNHPEQGLIPPLDFIPLAEDTGLIVPLGKWILEEACAQAATWQTDYGFGANLSITVNVASRQFQDETLLATVRRALVRSKLPPQSLVLEITETTMLKNTDTTINKLNELKKLGIRFAIDDFGTGYSSLSYLQRFPVDILKIDKSFIDKIAMDKEGAAVAKAIITMSETLNLKTIAEGIESQAQRSELRKLGCELGQGYHFAKPLRAKAMSKFLRDSVNEDKTLPLISILANANGLRGPAIVG